MSERRACAVVAQSRSTHRYRARRRPIPGLQERMIELAHVRPRFGYPRLHVLLRREGFLVNRKRVYRLYRLAGLKLRSRRRKHAARPTRGPLVTAVAPNDNWSMDFVSDRLADGRAFRTLTMVDDFSKLCPALEVDTSLPGLRVIRALERAIALYGKPRRITVDNGSEFTCRVMDAWAYNAGIELHFIDPGKPVQNAFAESFNSRFRDECLNQHQFAGLTEARTLIEDFRCDYNSVRPHSSLGGLSPEQFILGLTGAMAPVKPDHATQPQHALTLPEETLCPLRLP